MQQIEQIFGDEKFITNSNGEIESVLMTLSEYNKLTELLEDSILAKSMEKAESDVFFNKKDALDLLLND